jgi:polar amino acid transport system substrate-binding protein
MRQLTQKLKEGRLRVIDVPEPVLNAGQILVRAHHSVISSGTESSTVSAARKSYLGKAKERPEQFKQVLQTLKQKGPVQTYRAVMKKLDAHSPLGYSCAGEVVEVASDVRAFSPGDMVACGGAGYASHAEYVAVPVNLCVKLPSGANLEFAAYNTVGAIALQGIRQADLRLGETCVVIGLGLLGQLTCLMLRASGVVSVGIDIRPEAVEVAREKSADYAYATDEPGLEEKVLEVTGGVGADAVIIAAASSSEGPVNLAGRMSRKKGRVVIVGRVPTSFEQDTYYKKELDLRMSCSYGPGRYDINYEERGIDYPASYVRWTENRNMQAFQQLLSSGRIDLGFLTTHRFSLEDAPAAYDLILKHEENYLGIVIDYDVEKPRGTTRVELAGAAPPAAINIAFIGAGSYAMNNLLPNIKAGDVSLKGVMTAKGTSARSVMDRYGFQFCTADESDIWRDPDINTVFIATRHDSHAHYTIKALEEGKNVFVEKPMCLTEQELDEISAVVERLTNEGRSASLMVGYNRRFSPLSVALKELADSGPMSMIYRVNAGQMPADHWMQQPDIGGGRIIGEASHFIDYMIFMCGALPVEVHAAVMEGPERLEDTVNINLRFADGSIGVVSYFANGPGTLFKEYIEVYRAGSAGIMRDFKELETYGKRAGRRRLPGQNKGQPQMIAAYLDSIRKGAPSPIPYVELEAGMRATFKAIESFRAREVVRL